MKKEEYLNSINLNSGTDFPYLVLDVTNDISIPRNPGFQVMHWHEDLQLIYVLDGEIEVQTLDEKIALEKGNGIFINKNTVHHVKRKGLCHYKSFIFPDYFLKFYFNSPANDFVSRITENKKIGFLFFDKNIDWCKNILEKLEKLSSLEKDGNGFYIYQILVLLSRIWLHLIRNVQIPIENHKNVTSERMKKFLECIEKNYAENITLEQLAKCANVSKSECLRCFRKSLGCTPYNYLLEYRLSRAATLLKNTNDSIAEISSKVGFNQTSHFGKCFREKTGLSPLKFRKKQN